MTTPTSAPTERLDEDVRRQVLFAAHPSLVHLGARYEVRREIGSGGMGYVFEARDRETGEVLALKVLRPEIATDPAMAERFKNELRLARRITHKNVCRIYDFNRVESLAYISMEYVDGVTLRAHLDRTGVLPFGRVVSLARQIGAGLSEAHAQGIVHRDLKPENVMLTASGAVKLMDFGIARMVHPASTATQTLIGTPAYMSPEQAQGRGVDARSDIYALGLILYECLTARRAFAAPTPVAVALKQIQERPTPPHSIRPDIPRALEAAVLRCMEKEPARRFASVDELSRALAQSMTSDPTPVSASRRWPWLAAAVVLSVGAVMWNKNANVHTPPAAVPAAPPRLRRRQKQSALVWSPLVFPNLLPRAARKFRTSGWRTCGSVVRRSNSSSQKPKRAIRKRSFGWACCLAPAPRRYATSRRRASGSSGRRNKGMRRRSSRSAPCMKKGAAWNAIGAAPSPGIGVPRKRDTRARNGTSPGWNRARGVCHNDPNRG